MISNPGYVLVACCVYNYSNNLFSRILLYRGDVIASTEEKESIVYGEVDLKILDEIRKGLPLMTQKRYDIYSPVKVVTAGM